MYLAIMPTHEVVIYIGANSRDEPGSVRTLTGPAQANAEKSAALCN
jgi:hypothetical protein